MAFQGTTEVVALQGTVPVENYISAGAIAIGDVVTMAASGKVQKAAAASGSLDSTGLKIVGIARNATTAADQGVKVELLTGFTALVLPSYGAAPSLSILGAPGTKFVLYNDAGIFKANLNVSANGILQVVQNDPTDSRPTGADVPKASGFAIGDRVVVQPASTARFWA